MTGDGKPAADECPLELYRQIDTLCREFELAWQGGLSPRIEDYLERAPAGAQSTALAELVAQEVDLRRAAGQSVDPQEYRQRFRRNTGEIDAAFELLRRSADAVPPLDEAESVGSHSMSDTDDSRQSRSANEEALPAAIGRYRVRRQLGAGGFGTVYLAHDPDLDRPVALKVPRSDRFAAGEDREHFMAEAKTAAKLEHSGIVTVYDVFQDCDRVVIVQRYISGQDLQAVMKSGPLPPERAAELIVPVADAVAFAHRAGFVHRDLKPSNILLDERGHPHVADFGLAVHESLQRRRRGDRSGTPAYMSPEQVRGETHRQDGRSDIWSLGIVFYEMLTGRRPFAGKDDGDLFDEIEHRQARPPRQINPRVAAELERICLKCLSKRATDRYSSAVDLADDLRHWLAGSRKPTMTPSSLVEKPKVVPKGLRSFGEEDADFFLELLPGPRGRDGLPESIRFWKTRIEETDPDKTFSVGLIYGPSGCGKSSLMKAGLLPRLASHVLPIYVEATPADTEARLKRGLRKVCPGIPDEISLPELFASLRDGQWVPLGQKLVVVLDQFEQWLHAHPGEDEAPLLQSLRHCDGGRVQCVALVRDDFWLATSRFMQSLEVELLEGRNLRLVDLFDPLHASKVLTDFGQALGRLPDQLAELSPDQLAFLAGAVEGLSQDGRVICVRLSLFSDMMKGRSWTSASLREVGGTAGLGVTFLNETFSAATAPAQHRVHQQAARAVLKALLPELGTDIKGSMRSYGELLEASGYASRPLDFEQLIRILDTELRLITPTDPATLVEEDDPIADHSASDLPSSSSGLRTPDSRPFFYQLTHDYLVPSLREWLARKQKETRKGRAELKLDERTASWTSLRESKQLPTFWEWLSIRGLTVPKSWTAQQRLMMSKATRFHGLRVAQVLAAIVVMVCVGAVVRTEVNNRQEATRIQGLVGRLVSAEPNQLPDIVKELDSNPAVAKAYLSPLLLQSAKTPEEKRAQLHARLATVSRDPSQVDPLVEELLNGKVTYVLPIRQLLRPLAATLMEKFRRLLRDEKADAQQRFRAALALADYMPSSEVASWSDRDLTFVAEQLVSSNAEFQPLLRDALRPIREKLCRDLERVFRDVKATDARRLGAANALADYSMSQIAKLSSLLTVATPEQFEVLYPLVAASPSISVMDDLGRIAGTLPPEGMGSVERIPYGQRRANAAVALLRMGNPEAALPVFEMKDDPEALTQFIFRCRPRGVRAETLLECLQKVSDVPQRLYPRNTRYALLLALGEFALDEIPASRRGSLLKQVADWYANDPSSGVHGAAGWLLRQWGQTEIASRIEHTQVLYSPDREWFTLAITVSPTPPPKPGDRVQAGKAEDSAAHEVAKAVMPTAPPPPKTFYYTFVVFPAAEYTIGSPLDEPERSQVDGREQRHPVTLTHRFAMLDREVTLEELIAFSPRYATFIQRFKSQPSDAGFGADWYDSVAFSRWLGTQSRLGESDQAYLAPESLSKEEYPRESNASADWSWAPRDWPVQLERRGFRLPTEAEWEIAARGGARTSYCFGSEVGLLGRFGWFTENSGKQVRPPKELRPSLRGLFDMHGNLCEWTHDWYCEFGTEGVTDPRGPQKGTSRVDRGGSWDYDTASCRTANRDTDEPTGRTNYFGFRLAISLPVGPPEAVQDKK